MNIPILTILTPTYNRSDLLKNCYASLMNQTCKSFEWIIIDDGSTDQTAETVGKMIDESVIKIKYKKKENGGKHTALNAAHDLISGDYVLMLDSDDKLTDDAVETVLNGWKQFEDNLDVGMLIWLKGKSKNEPNCTVREEGIIVDYQSYSRTVIHSLDCCEVLRSELFKMYPFPVFENERFISEGALWNRVSEDHMCVYFNQVIYLCEYLEGGLTKSGKKLRIRNPHGGMYTSFLRMGKRHVVMEKAKGAVLYSCYGHFAGMQSKAIYSYQEGHSFLKLCGLLPGYLLYLRWKRIYGE